MSWKIPKEKIDAICADCEEQVWELEGYARKNEWAEAKGGE